MLWRRPVDPQEAEEGRRKAERGRQEAEGDGQAGRVGAVALLQADPANPIHSLALRLPRNLFRMKKKYFITKA